MLINIIIVAVKFYEKSIYCYVSDKKRSVISNSAYRINWDFDHCFEYFEYLSIYIYYKYVLFNFWRKKDIF